MATPGLILRAARPGEAPLVFDFVMRLAEYERLAHEVVTTAGDLDAALFGPTPRVFCDIAELDGEPVGFALWFYNFSTFVGGHGIYLEDLFVNPQARGKGVGKALLARLAGRCAEEGLGRFQWAVLDWNTPSIAFYKSLGAQPMSDWIVNRLSGDALTALAEAQA